MVSFCCQKILPKTSPTLRRPFLFSKKDWPAATRWQQLAYLDSVAGHRLVPTELGADVGDSSWKEEFMSFGRFLKDRDLLIYIIMNHVVHHASSKKCHWNMVMGCRSWCLPVVGAPHLPQHTWHNMSCSSSARFFARTSLFLLHGKRHLQLLTETQQLYSNSTAFLGPYW